MGFARAFGTTGRRPMAFPGRWGWLVVVLLITRSVEAADPRVTKRPSPEKLRAGAVSAVPLQVLSPDVREKVAPLLAEDSIHRRIASEVLPCDPHLYLFLVNEPDVTVAIWRALGISEVELERVGSGRYQGSDGHGWKGTFQFLYRSSDRHLIWFHGVYQGPLLSRPVTASALLLLRSAYFQESDGNMYVAHCLDVFLKLDRGPLLPILRLLNPLWTLAARQNFSEMGLFLASMSLAADHRPGWVLELIERLEDITPQQRQRLQELVQQQAQRVHRARSSSAGRTAG